MLNFNGQRLNSQFSEVEIFSLKERESKGVLLNEV